MVLYKIAEKKSAQMSYAPNQPIAGMFLSLSLLLLTGCGQSSSQLEADLRTKVAALKQQAATGDLDASAILGRLVSGDVDIPILKSLAPAGETVRDGGEWVSVGDLYSQSIKHIVTELSDDHDKLKWVTAAAEKGYDGAEYVLGKGYLTGTDGLITDYGKADQWLERSALHGNSLAVKQLVTNYSGDNWKQHTGRFFAWRWLYHQYCRAFSSVPKENEELWGATMGAEKQLLLEIRKKLSPTERKEADRIVNTFEANLHQSALDHAK
jgi:hypothetical protein